MMMRRFGKCRQPDRRNVVTALDLLLQQWQSERPLSIFKTSSHSFTHNLRRESYANNYNEGRNGDFL